jgi:hypothetical protein
MQMPETAVSCWVCGETETDRRLVSECDSCGQLFHLNPYQTPGKDCGDVDLIEEDDPVLEFFCRPCMEGTTEALRAQRGGQ